MRKTVAMLTAPLLAPAPHAYAADFFGSIDEAAAPEYSETLVVLRNLPAENSSLSGAGALIASRETQSTEAIEVANAFRKWNEDQEAERSALARIENPNWLADLHDHSSAKGPGLRLDFLGSTIQDLARSETELPTISTFAAGNGEESSADTKTIAVSANLTVVSDYRFRGLSLSNRDPAAQATFEVEHKSGFYGGFWGSTIKNMTNANVEADLYAGWRGNAGGLDFDVGAVGYFYPNQDDVDYFELTASVSYSLGPALVELGAAIAPKQSNIGGDSLYAYAEASVGVPNTPMSLTAHAGREAGALEGPDGAKWDWSLGAEVVVDRFTLGLTYVDTNVHRLADPDRNGRAGVLASFKIEF